MGHPSLQSPCPGTSITGTLKEFVPSVEFIYTHPFSDHPAFLQTPTSISLYFNINDFENLAMAIFLSQYQVRVYTTYLAHSIVFFFLMFFSSSQFPRSFYPPIYKYLLHAHMSWNSEIQITLSANVSFKLETGIYCCLV